MEIGTCVLPGYPAERWFAEIGDLVSELIVDLLVKENERIGKPLRCSHASRPPDVASRDHDHDIPPTNSVFAGVWEGAMSLFVVPRRDLAPTPLPTSNVLGDRSRK